MATKYMICLALAVVLATASTCLASDLTVSLTIVNNSTKDVSLQPVLDVVGEVLDLVNVGKIIKVAAGATVTVEGILSGALGVVTGLLYKVFLGLFGGLIPLLEVTLPLHATITITQVGNQLCVFISGVLEPVCVALAL